MAKKQTQAEAGDRARLDLNFDKPHLLGAVFGQYDQNLVAIENRLGVYIGARGNRVQIEGEAEAAARARDVLMGLYNRVSKGQEIDPGAVEAVIAMSAEPTLDGIIRHDVAQPPSVMIRTRKKTIVPRSATQTRYMEELARRDVIFALGPAGTGKTYLAVAQAVSQLITGSVDRLILSRPAVEAGERLGFLPGDMKEKVDPYLRPLYDALYDTLPAEQVERRIASGEIEIAPLAFMRGRTLANAFIILDEAQNTTPGADEDVPHPLRRGQPHGDLRRPQSGGSPADGGRLGPCRRGRAAGGRRRHLRHPLQRGGRGAPPHRWPHRAGL
jgi:phosphate starvation-inducible PhoH-like protein